MSASAEFQKLLIDTLKADAGVAALVGAHVYDEIPTARPVLCISIGPSDYRPLDLDCLTVGEITMQVDVFNRSGRKLVQTRRVIDAMIEALDGAALVLPDPYAIARIDVELARVFRGPDGTGTRGVVQVTAEIQVT